MGIVTKDIHLSLTSDYHEWREFLDQLTELCEQYDVSIEIDQ